MQQIEQNQCNFVKTTTFVEFYEALRNSVRCVIVFDDPLGETVMNQMYGGLMKQKNIYGIISMNESIGKSWIERIP